MDEHNDGSGQLWPYLFSTCGATLADVGIHFHGSTTTATISGVVVPIEYFLTLARHEIELEWQFVVGGAKRAHLESFVIGDWLVDAKRLHFAVVKADEVIGMRCHRCDVVDCCLWFYIKWRFFAIWNGVGSIIFFLKQQVGLAEYEPIFLHTIYMIFVCDRFLFVMFNHVLEYN